MASANSITLTWYDAACVAHDRCGTMHSELKSGLSWPTSPMKQPEIQGWIQGIRLNVGWGSSTCWNLQHVDRTMKGLAFWHACTQLVQSNQSEQPESWVCSTLYWVRNPWGWSWSLHSEAAGALNLPVLNLLGELNNPQVAFSCLRWNQHFNPSFETNRSTILR